MSNIYEALEQAQREQNGEETLNALPVSDASGIVKRMPFRSISMRGRMPTRGKGISMDREMYCLYQNIEFLLPDISEKTLMFLGLQGGEGVSTIVQEFARMASARLGKKVLVLDSSHRDVSPQLFLDARTNKVEDTSGCADMASSQTVTCVNCPAPMTPHPDLVAHEHDLSTTAGYADDLNKNYDMTLIDYSMTSALHGSMAITRKAHGVVLVIEAERTRWQVIESAKNRIERNGGNIIGFVFNKRRYYIPDAMYRFLFKVGNNTERNPS